MSVLPQIRLAFADDLRQVPLLEKLGEEPLARLAAGTSHITCADHTQLFSEGTRAQCLHILLSGTVELFTADDKEMVTAIIWPGEPFIPAAALSDEAYLVSARTLGPSQLLCIEAALFRAELAQNPELGIRVIRTLCAQFRLLQRSLIATVQPRPASQRLGAFLLRLIEARGKQGCVDLPIPKYKLAARLGMTPETVSRSLGVLRRHGLVVRGRRVVIADRARFERYCRRHAPVSRSDTNLRIEAL